MNYYEKIRLIITHAIQQTPSADNSQPWKIIWKNNTLTLSYDTPRIAGQTFPPANPAILLSMGAAIENLHQAADALDIKLRPLPTPVFDQNKSVYYQAAISLPEQAVKFPDTGLALFQRHTNRFPYQAKKIDDSQLTHFKKLTVNTQRIRVIDNKKAIGEVSQLVRKASEIRFRTPELNEWLGRSLRFGKQAEQSGEGLDVATLDLPPGGALFLRLVSDWRRMQWLNYLSAYKFMSYIDSLPVKNAPALVAIIGPKGFDETLAAGRLMERAWIDLNAQGIAVHPYFVISDQINRLHENTVPSHLLADAKQLGQQAIDLFNLKKGEHLHMLFRIGYPTKTAKRSRRLPLEKISIDLD